MITRAQHVTHLAANDTERRIAHRAYYAQFVTGPTVRFVVNTIGPDRLKESTDRAFNDIGLDDWDDTTRYMPYIHRWTELGDSPSFAGLVCIAKEAAHQYLDGAKS